MASYFYIYVLQTAFSTITNASALYITIYSDNNDIGWTDTIGTIVWFTGFAIEVVADM